MKKSSEEQILLNKDYSKKKNIFSDKIKTTNVNVLLNRVRLNKKNDLKKKIFFSFLVILILASISIFVII